MSLRLRPTGPSTSLGILSLMKDKRKGAHQESGCPLSVSNGSPCATLFITVFFLPQLTENIQYQRVIKEQAVPGGPEAASSHISPGPSTTAHVAKAVVNMSQTSRKHGMSQPGVTACHSSRHSISTGWSLGR